MMSRLLSVTLVSVLLPLSVTAQNTLSGISGMLEMSDLDAVSVESADCDMGTDQASYTIGETVTISVFALSNTSPDPGSVEWKAWLNVPSFNPIGFINVGSDGSLVLPTGFDANLGPISLFVVAAGFPAGTYILGCRVLDPVTGALLSEDFHSFDIVHS